MAKKIRKRILLIVMACLMVLTCLSAYAAPPYTALDLSKTQTAYTKGQTGQVVVYGINGDTSEQVATGVTFVSSDPAVVQVDASTGAFTAKGEGFATITASCSGISQKVALIVYSSLKKEFDMEKEPYTKDVVWADDDKTPYPDAYSYDTSISRLGKKSLLTKTIVDPKMTATARRYYTKNFLAWYLMAVNAPYNDGHLGVLEVWFYDDGAPNKHVGLLIGGHYDGNNSHTLDRDGNVITSFPDGSNSQPWKFALTAHVKLDGENNTYSFTNERATFGEFTTLPVTRSKGWHQLLIDVTKDDTYNFYIDGQLLATRSTPGYLSNAGVETVAIEYCGPSTTEGEANHVIALDNIKFYNVTPPDIPQPMVKDLSVTGEAEVGKTLTASFTYIPAEAEQQEDCDIQWLRSTTKNAAASDWTPITGATSKTYTLSEADIDHFLKVSVTPKQEIDPQVGETVSSDVITAPFHPVATDIKVDGGGVVGRELTATYKYYDENDGQEESGSVYRWLVSDTNSENPADYTPIVGADGLSLTVGADLAGKYIKFEVTPKNASNPQVGETAYSAAIAVISNNSAPTAQNPAVSRRMFSSGFALATYEYSDPDGDAPGTPVYEWFICDTQDGTYAPIEGESAEMLPITDAMWGKYIKFAVTPADTYGLSGAKAESPAVLLERSDSSKLFVATDGNDEMGNGSLDHPFATLEKARDTIREMKDSDAGLPNGGVTVYVRGGDYALSESFALGEQDSGTADKPIIYRNYQNEKVTLTGGAVIDPTKAEPIPDDIKNRIIDTAARDKIVKIDLKAQGIPESNYAVPFEKNADILVTPELFVNSQAMTIARWPNDDFVRIGEVRDPGSNPREGDTSNKPFVFKYADERIEKWQDSDDLWMFGQWYYDWYGEHIRIANMNKGANTITSACPSMYSVRSGQKYYYFNILEEVDAPGEYYLDKQNGILYFYPPEPLSADTSMSLSYLSEPVILMNKAAHVRVQGFEIDSSMGDGIVMRDAESVTVDRCTLSNLGKVGIDITGGHNQTVQNSHIYNTGAGGVFIETGNRRTLEPGNTLVENCEIHRTDRLKNNKAPTIKLWGTGNIVRHNKLYDTKNMGVYLAGNENIFEYNELYDMIKETTDIGAIYAGRNPTMLGNVIQYNYFHDIHATWPGEHESNAIFIDDGFCDVKIYGNIFYEAGDGDVFRIWGGFYHTFENNISVARPNNETPNMTNMATWRDGKWINWIKGIEWPDHNVQAMLDEVQPNLPPFSEKYPWLVGAPDIPNPADSTNKVVNNVAVGHQRVNNNVGYWVSKPTMSGNWLTTGDPGFVDMENRDLNLKADSEVFTRIPDFEPLPFDKMGMYSEITNQKPAVTDLQISGKKSVGNLLIGSYTFLDIEGDLDNGSVYEWLVSDRQNGTYEPISGQNGITLNLTDELAGKFIKFRVTPKDETGSVGETKESAPVSIVGDKESLLGFIQNAQQEAENSTQGSGLGEYPQAAIDALEAAITKAEEVYNDPSSSMDKIGSEADALAQAMETFKAAQITHAVLAITGGTVTIPEGLRALTLELPNLSEEVALAVPEGKLPASEIKIKANAVDINIQIAEGTTIAGNRITLFKPLDKPSVSIIGEASGAFVFGEPGADYNKPVRISISGAAGQSVLWVTDGSATEIVNKLEGDSADALGSQPYGKIDVGNDIVVWTSKGGEYVTASLERPSSDATLSMITIDGVNLSGFKSDQYSYTYKLAAGATQIPTVGATTNDKYATLNIQQADSLSGTATILVNPPDGGKGATYSVTFKEYKKNTPTPAPVDPIGPGSSSGSNGNSSIYTDNTAGNPMGISTATPKPSQPQARYTDTAGHWAQADIEEMAERGIVSGVTETTFEPDRDITRAEFATLMAKALNLPLDASAAFEDVRGDEWYVSYVNAAAEAGLIIGYDGYFRPDEVITREEMAVIVVKAGTLLGKALEERGGNDRFVDKDDIASWANESVDIAASNGLISGMTPDRFAPHENTTRAQAVSVIKRLLDQ